MSLAQMALIPAAIILGIMMFLLIAWLFQWLWNTTLPDVFNFKAVTFWQSVRLLIIAAILFGIGSGIKT